MIRIRVRENALSIAEKESNGVEPTIHLRKFWTIMKALQGRELVLVGPIIDGISGRMNALLPEGEPFDRCTSRVISLKMEWIDPIEEVDEGRLQAPPTANSRYVKRHEQAGVKMDLNVVWLLSEQMDGHIAYAMVNKAYND